LASVVVLFGGNLAAAPETKPETKPEAKSQVNPEAKSQAKPAGLAVTADPSGSLVVREGDKIVGNFVPKTDARQRGAATASERQVAGRAVVEVRLPVIGDGSRREEVWIAERSSGGAKLIWWDFAGALDPDGETTMAAEVSAAGIQIYQTAARLSRCDGLPVRLFPKTWDFGTRTFKAAAPTLPARATTSVQARRGGAPEGRSLGGFFFSAASTSAGALGDATRLKPPAAVNDGNPSTVWASDGDARGQLLTARSSGGFPIIGLRLLPGDPGSDKTYRASAKPRKLSLILGKNAADNVDVDLIEDSDGGAGRSKVPFWIPLPRPVASTCVTVVVREATSDKGPMSIADLDVMTELDGPQAADRLVESLGHGTACEARQPLLVRMGEPALGKVATAIVKTPAGAGRTCLVEALAALLATGAPASPEVGAALAAAVLGASPAEEKLVLRLLPRLTAPPVSILAGMLQDQKRPETDRLRAAALLAEISGEEATQALLAVLGQGDQTMRRALRKVFWRLKPPAALAAKAALDATPAGETARRSDLLLVLAVLSKGEPASRPAALATLTAALDGPASFEEQARAIAGLGSLLGLANDPAVLAKLVDVRAHNPDGVLRHLAITELAAAKNAEVIPALRSAVADTDPRVRETAAAALGYKRDKGAADLLIAGAKQEPWPSVRRAEIAALGELCTPAGDEIIQRALKRDVDEVRQAALVGLAHCYGAKANPALLQILGRLPESADMRSLAARLLAERKDGSTVPGMAEALVRLVREIQADMSLQTVIVDTAMALATIRTPEAISALVGLVSEPDVAVKRAGIDALGIACDPGAGAAALRSAAQSKDEAVSIPAAAAEAHCRDRR
jgi:HEAT repeat protein